MNAKTLLHCLCSLAKASRASQASWAQEPQIMMLLPANIDGHPEDCNDKSTNDLYLYIYIEICGDVWGYVGMYGDIC